MKIFAVSKNRTSSGGYDLIIQTDEKGQLKARTNDRTLLSCLNDPEATEELWDREYTPEQEAIAYVLRKNELNEDKFIINF